MAIVVPDQSSHCHLGTGILPVQLFNPLLQSVAPKLEEKLVTTPELICNLVLVLAMFFESDEMFLLCPLMQICLGRVMVDQDVLDYESDLVLGDLQKGSKVLHGNDEGCVVRGSLPVPIYPFNSGLDGVTLDSVDIIGELSSLLNHLFYDKILII